MPRSFLRAPPLDYNLLMSVRCLPSRTVLRSLALAATVLLLSCTTPAQNPPAPSAGRILMLPRTMVSGERATLAVLDVNGRLTPRAAILFSNGDRLTTDATGRALFVAPLNPGVITGSIVGHQGNVPVKILAPAETVSLAIEVDSIPKVASLSD